MSKPKFVVHVGYPKSASTALQQACFDSRKWLRQRSVIYPSSLRLGEAKHEELFRLVRLGKVKKAITALREELAGQEAKVIFLSTESIVNQLDNVDDFRWVELFSSLKELGSIELIVVVRDPEELLKSYYKQSVVNQPPCVST